jgi:hypothetical protein
MDKIHPCTWILWGLLMVSIVTNYVQLIQLRRLDKQLAPVIIRQNIRLFEQAPKSRYI